MTKRVRRLSIVMLFMFVSLFAAVSWIQVIDADALAQNGNNKRTQLDSFEIQRGSIVVDGVAIATSVPSGDRFLFRRVYTDAAMWEPVTGYFNAVLGSATGIERALNVDLSGSGSNTFFAEIERALSGQPKTGFDVELTLDATAQKAAYDALEGLQGSVVALEPSTGRILAMVSTPGFDTNSLAMHDAGAASAAYDALIADPSKPLSNRALAGDLNPPGSTFKLIVAAAAFESGDFTPQSTLPNPARYQLPGSTHSVSNSSGAACGPGETVSIAEAIRLSCNIPMAELAVELGDDAIRGTAERFGFNQSLATPLASTASSYPHALDDAQTALSGFGQGQVTATPLQIAMVSAGIANEGVVMYPRMVDAVVASDLSLVRSYDDVEFGRALNEANARALLASMTAGVRSGAAQQAGIDGVAVAGKTGTAENGDRPHTLWFTGFAPADDPQIAIAVLVEDGGGEDQSEFGDSIAAPIAKKVMEAVLSLER